MLNRLLKIFLVFFWVGFLSAQNTSETTTRDFAVENIADVLFDSKAKSVRDRTKAFENANGIKLLYKVEDQSLDKLGGLSEHLFKLFQTFTSPVNTNARTITGEFSAISNNVLSDILTYKTNATADLRNCVVPLTDSRKQDSLYNKFLHGSLLTQEDINNAPENLEGLYSQAPYDYEKILIKNASCPGIFAPEYLMLMRTRNMSSTLAVTGKITGPLTRTL
jgi:hypothetical protein